MAREQDVFQVPFTITELDDDAAVLINRNFEEVARLLGQLQTSIKQLTGGSVKDLVTTLETVSGAQAKADAALASATSFTEQYAERKVTVGTTPPATPATYDLWLDYNFSPPVWKQWNGTAWVKITRSLMSEINGQITSTQITDESITTPKLAANAVTADKIAANVITTNHISTAGLDAGVITTGTMVADRIRGGTLILGGSSNQYGTLQILSSTGSEKVYIDSTYAKLHGPQLHGQTEIFAEEYNGISLIFRAEVGSLTNHATIEVSDTGVLSFSTINDALMQLQSAQIYANKRIRGEGGVSSASPLRVFGNTDPIVEITDASGARKGYVGYITSSTPNGIWIRNAVAGTILCLADDKTLQFYNGTSWKTL